MFNKISFKVSKIALDLVWCDRWPLVFHHSLGLGATQ
jgi:hypothetical protein